MSYENRFETKISACISVGNEVTETIRIYIHDQELQLLAFEQQVFTKRSKYHLFFAYCFDTVEANCQEKERNLQEVTTGFTLSSNCGNQRIYVSMRFGFPYSTGKEFFSNLFYELKSSVLHVLL